MDEALKQRVTELEAHFDELSYKFYKKLGSSSSDIKSPVGIFEELYVRGYLKTVYMGDNIQNAIDELDDLGGGIVQLSAGTHDVDYEITMKDGVHLVGAGSGSTTIHFNSTSYQVSIEGTLKTSAGTVSVTNGSTTVNGSGTSFTSAVAGDKILLSGVWYTISVITDDDTLTIAIPFADTTLSTVACLIVDTIEDVRIRNVTIRSSAFSNIFVEYANELSFDDVTVLGGDSYGMQIEDSSNITFDQCEITASTNDNIYITNCHYVEINGCGFIDSLTGDGLQIADCTNVLLRGFFCLNPATHGINMTGSSDVSITASGSVSAGGNGFSLGSSNNRILIQGCKLLSNASDGIELTATSDNVIISNNIIHSNGAYGVNIAASSCDTNLIIGNNFASNVTAASSDSGTGTLIRSNIGLADN